MLWIEVALDMTARRRDSHLEVTQRPRGKNTPGQVYCGGGPAPRLCPASGQSSKGRVIRFVLMPGGPIAVDFRHSRPGRRHRKRYYSVAKRCSPLSFARRTEDGPRSQDFRIGSCHRRTTAAPRTTAPLVQRDVVFPAANGIFGTTSSRVSRQQKALKDEVARLESDLVCVA